MKAKGAEVLCVGIGKSKANARLIRQLQELASKPEYVFETTFDVLETIENTLVKEVCEAIGKSEKRVPMFYKITSEVNRNFGIRFPWL